MSDAVSADGEFTEMHWGVRFETIELFIGETLVWSEDTDEDNQPSLWSLYSYFDGDETDQWAYFDWAELWGIPIEEGKAEPSGDWQTPEGPESLRIVGPASLGAHGTDVVAQ